jgi:hypothetical protein
MTNRHLRNSISVCAACLLAVAQSRAHAEEEALAGLHVARPDRAQEAYMIFPDSPPFEVVPRVKDTDMHPCSDCHEWAESDPTPRLLDEPHDNFRLKHGLHGKGKFWCFTCHFLEGDGGLRTLEGDRLPFDQAYIVCSQCHSQEARDWAFGAHGKRIDNWQGPRRILNCTVCHYQHTPAIDPRAPRPPRPVPSLPAASSPMASPAPATGAPVQAAHSAAETDGGQADVP